jgi:hypothetical protein
MKINNKHFKEEDSFAVFETSSEHIVKAHERSCEIGILPNSFTRGMGRMVGCLGEIAVNHLIPRSKYVGNKIFSHDIVSKKRRIEVKSKTCTSAPKGHYIASVNGKENMSPDNDIYFFTRVRKDLMFVWIVGWLPTEDLFKRATFKARGEKDDCDFVYSASGYHIPIEGLNKVGDF